MPIVTDRSVVAEVSQIGIETLAAPGVKVPCSVLLQAMSFILSPMAEIDTYGPSGQKYKTLAITNKEWSGFEITGKPTYSEIIYFFAMLLGDPVITTPGGGTLSRQFLFSPASIAADSVRTASMQQGTPGYTQAEQATYGLLQSGTISFSRNGGNNLSGSGIAQRETLDVALDTNEIQQIAITGAPTGGTFTLTFSGQTTAAIVWNAAAAAVKSALELLSNIGTDGILAAGGALPATPVTVEFRGRNAQSNAATLTATASLTGGTTPAVVITTPTPGVAPTAVPLVPISPGEVSLYMDDTSAGIGTTKLLRPFVYEWSLADRQNPIYPLNSALSSFDGKIENLPTPSLKLTLGNDAVGRALLTTMRAGSFKYLRLEAIGPLIEGSIFHRLRMDTALKVTAAPNRSDIDKLSVLEWTFEMMHDAAWGKAMEVAVINTQTAL